MVAFLRSVLVALRTTSPSDTDATAGSSTLDHHRHEDQLQAILSGRPYMDGPLILRPEEMEADAETSPFETPLTSNLTDMETESSRGAALAETPTSNVTIFNTTTTLANSTAVQNDTINLTAMAQAWQQQTQEMLGNLEKQTRRLQISARKQFLRVKSRLPIHFIKGNATITSDGNGTSSNATMEDVTDDEKTTNDTVSLSIDPLDESATTTSATPEQTKPEPTFSLYDWTQGFRHAVRLAMGTGHSSLSYRNRTMSLTPTLRVAPPPYTMSKFGGGEERYEKMLATAQEWQPTADYDKGQLVLLFPPPEPETSLQIMGVPGNISTIQNNTNGNVTESLAEPREKVITTAEWLVQPSTSASGGNNDCEPEEEESEEDTLSIARNLKAYLLQLLVDEEDGVTLRNGIESFQDRVDYAISLSARTELGTEAADEDDDTDEMNVNSNTTIQTPIHKDARVRAYAPSYFAKLRQSYGIQESEYWESLLDEDSPFVSFQSNSKGAQRVGGIFFFTRNGAYMIKTIKPDEVGSFLGDILPKYGPYMKQWGKQSLLTRFCGLYQVKLYAKNGTDTVERSRAHTFAVMNAVFPAQASQSIAERFDLKGSILGRQCSEAEIKSKGSLAILKDLDLLKEVEFVRSAQQFSGDKRNRTPNFLMQKEGLHIGPAAKATLMSQLRRDAELLADCNAIDYSLLVGVAPRQSPMLNYLKSLVSVTRGTLKFLFPAFVAPPPCNIRLMFGPSSYWEGEQHAPSNKQLCNEDQRSYAMVYNDQLEHCGVDGGPLSRMNGERLGVPSLYYFGLIDFLQPYNIKKTAEFRFKGWKYGMKAGYSCIPPKPYAGRFLAFLDRHMT